MKQLGIWMDKQKAFIINPKKETIKKILSEIDDYHIKGGSGTALKGGPQDVVQDSKYLEREKHQYRNYFKKIAAAVGNVDKLIIFSPAEAGLKFRKELKNNYKEIYSKLQGCIKADSMTDNQTRALIKDYFEKQQ